MGALLGRVSFLGRFMVLGGNSSGFYVPIFFYKSDEILKSNVFKVIFFVKP